MKKYITAMAALLLLATSAYGQTVDKLFEKYKALPVAEWANHTDSFRIQLKQRQSSGKSEISDKECTSLLKSIKKVEQLAVPTSGGLRQQLEEDFKKLKNYDCILSDSRRPSRSDSTENKMQQILTSALNPKIDFRVYGKVKGENVKDVLICLDMWQSVFLIHIDGKISKELVGKLFTSSEGVQQNPHIGYSKGNEDIVDMKNVMESYKQGDVLFVINGKAHPELRSGEEARNYMISNNIGWNKETWVVGAKVKEKYPNTDKPLVVEYSLQQ